MNAADDRFCDECGVSLDLHFYDGDCEGADRRAELIEQFSRFGGRV